LLVIVYGVMGGLMAAYWTDLIQGVFIIFLSIILIPSGLKNIVAKYGDPETQGVLDGFAIMHDRLSPEYFQLFEGPSAGEFPLHYIISLTLLALVGIVVQPHFIATGGGSAKNELTARVGLVTGNFLKRLCTVGWGLTGLIVLVLLADSIELSQDPDKVWGVAAREVLGPLNLGLVGLMLACLLAALMSSADTYMIVSSALVVRNVFAAFIDPNASEQACVRLARITGLVIIAGAAVASLLLQDVFAQFKLALELPIVFAAPFWIGMWWRRAGKWAAWGTMGVSLVIFFVLPTTMTSMRDNPAFLGANRIVETTTTRPATEVDVAQREAAIGAWRERLEAATTDEARAALGPEPETLALGDTTTSTLTTGGKAIFWTGGLKAVGPNGEALAKAPPTQVVNTTRDEDRTIVEKVYTGQMRGDGNFRVDFLVYHWLDMDLESQTSAMLETLRLPPRLLTPFIVMIVLGLILPRNSEEALNRYYAKMKTPVEHDHESDQLALEAAYANPERLEEKKLFPGTSLEIQRPSVADVLGFILCFGVCFLVISLLVGLAGIGG
jgi:SSS family solute:Na+ symporter